tara:strand:- start:1196 stop:1918 length:723 start_codon:yes stop_codon:yes gene_type:complete
MKGLKKFNKFTSIASKLIYPWECCLCGASETSHAGVCDACIHLLPRCLGESLCAVCGLPISADKSIASICGECQTSPPYYDSIHANFWYQAPIDTLISGYKYFNQWENARSLIDLSMDSFASISGSGLVIPVPSHPARVRERGFNAVYELVRLFSKEIKFKYELDAILRTKNTETQTGKLKSQRKKNVRNAFTLVRPLNYDHVIIFDEVVTTTATVNELSRCLKNSGVKQVTVWAIARTK